MTMAFALLATLQAGPMAAAPLVAAPAAPAQTPLPGPAPAPVPPAELGKLPPLPWRKSPRITPELTSFIVTEVKAGRCTLATAPLNLDFAVFVRGDGIVRRVVPRAIGCPTVEQFGAGLVTSMARGNLRSPAAGWYRARLSSAWRR